MLTWAIAWTIVNVSKPLPAAGGLFFISVVGDVLIMFAVGAIVTEVLKRRTK